MPASQFAAHLAASQPVTGPLNFLALVESFVQSIGGSLIASPEAKAALKKTVMDVYDAITANMAKANVALGMLFAAFRPAVDSLVDSLLNRVPPSPVTPPAPIGSASP